MAYRRSFPLGEWLGDRQQALRTLAQAHQLVGDVVGPGRPSEPGRALAHAYVIRLVAEFQGFARDLHSLGADVLVARSGVEDQHRAQLVAAVTLHRRLDRGNASLRALGEDFQRLGIRNLAARMETMEAVRWASDKSRFGSLMGLRNALAHGDREKLERLRAQGIRDTRTWAERTRPTLNRMARRLDRVVWDHLREQFREDPW